MKIMNAKKTTKKMLTIVLCAMLALSLAACGSGDAAGNPDGGQKPDVTDNPGADQGPVPGQADEDGQNDTQIPNPFVDCATMDEAAEIAGYELSAPETIGESCSRSAIRAMEQSMIEVVYQDGQGEEGFRIRKAPGSADISGDYNEYSQINTVEADGQEVTMKGQADKVNLAVWSDGEYTFAVSSIDGLDSAAMAELVQSVQ